MGTVIKLKDFNYNKPPGLLCPIIYCNGQAPIDLTTYSINVRLVDDGGYYSLIEVNSSTYFFLLFIN